LQIKIIGILIMHMGEEEPLLDKLVSKAKADEYFRFVSPDIADRSAVSAEYIHMGKAENIFYSKVDDGRLLVSATGELDSYSAPGLKAIANYQIDRFPQIYNIEIDCTEVKFIDSTSLGVLVGMVRKIRVNYGRSGQAEPSQPVIKTRGREIPSVMKVTGLDRIFKVEPVEEA
jgi:anti-sigma B factor antagonist